jgi:hypothetical protein
VDNGAVIFEVTNLTPETVTFTATDTTDGVVLDQTASVTFSVPPAVSAGITAFPTTVTANGMATTTITVTLQDVLGRPTPGKLITLSQGNGHSVITGPNPSVTDSNGQIQFTATNLVNEVVTYTAVDVTDGDLPVPGNAVVTFSNGSGTACGQNEPLPVGLNGYTVTPFVTGFATAPLSFGNINFGFCAGVHSPAFLDGSVYVPNFLNTDGVILELDSSTGAVLRTVAANLPCPIKLYTNPRLTWSSGRHSTLLTLNLGPTGGTLGQPIDLIASLAEELADYNEGALTPGCEDSQGQ